MTQHDSPQQLLLVLSGYWPRCRRCVEKTATWGLWWLWWLWWLGASCGERASQRAKPQKPRHSSQRQRDSRIRRWDLPCAACSVCCTAHCVAGQEFCFRALNGTRFSFYMFSPTQCHRTMLRGTTVKVSCQDSGVLIGRVLRSLFFCDVMQLPTLRDNLSVTTNLRYHLTLEDGTDVFSRNVNN